MAVEKRHFRNTDYERHSYYSAGSAAVKVEPLGIPSVEQQVKSRKVRRSKETQHINHKLKLVFSVFIVFGCCIALMMGYASITYEQKQLRILKAQLREKQDQNYTLKTEIAENIDIAYIEKRSGELGMIKPAKHQIVFIDVPKQNHTIQYEPEHSSIEESKIPILLGFLHKGR